MRRIGRFFRTIFRLVLVYVIAVSVIGGILFFAPDVWSPPLLRQIEKQAKERWAIDLQAQRLRWIGFWPMVWELEQPKFVAAAQGLSGSAQAVRLRFFLSPIDNNWARPKVDLGLSFLGPKIVVSLPEPAPTTAKANIPVAPAQGRPLPIVRPTGADLAVSLAFEHGVISVLRGQSGTPIVLDGVDFTFELPTMRTDVWRPKLTAKGQLGMDVASLQIRQPVEVVMNDIELGAAMVKLGKADLKFANLPFQVTGQYEFITRSYEANFSLPQTDVAKVPVSFLPPGQWGGKFSGEFQARSMNGGPVNASGSLKSEGLAGTVDIKKGETTIKGEIIAGGSLRFNYHDKLRLDDFSATVDLLNTTVDAPPWFLKPKGINMFAEVVSDGDGEVIHLRRASLTVAHMKVTTAGTIALAPGGEADLKISWPLTEIAGLEKNILPLSHAPLTGKVGAEVNVSGPWREPKGVLIEARAIELQRVSGQIRWKSVDGLTVDGPFGLNAKVTALVRELALNQSTIAGTIDFSRMKVVHPTAFAKPANWPFMVSVNGRWADKKLTLTNLTVAGDGDRWGATGTIQLERVKAPINLNITAKNIKIEQWLQWLKNPPVKAGGLVNGAVNLKGAIHFDEGVAGSPLKLKGEVDIVGAWLNHKSPLEPPTPVRAAPKVPVEPQPLLPGWPIIRSSDVVLNLRKATLQVDDLKARAIEVRTRFASGQIAGQIQIGDLWGGFVETQKLIVSPLVAPPTIETQARWARLETGQILEWFSPKFKGYMSGPAQGKVSILGPLPTGVDALKQMKVDGDVNISNGRFLTWNLESKINEKLSSMGIGKDKAVKTKPVAFLANLDFDLNDGIIHLAPFHLITSDRDELRVQGNLDLDMKLDLAGTAKVASQKIGGSIASANQDQSGRLVIPLQVRGTLLDPEFSFAESTVKGMLKKTAEHELNKAKEKLGNDVKKKLKGLLGK